MNVVLAFHIIAMVAWFAGLFYLPRLFVYHADTTDEISLKRFEVMERRLFWGIMTPAAVLTTGFGLWLLCVNWAYYSAQGWMHAKLLMVFLLILYHVWCGFIQKQFAQGVNAKSSKFYRYFNELPTVFLIVIVLLVVVRPAWL